MTANGGSQAMRNPQVTVSRELIAALVDAAASPGHHHRRHGVTWHTEPTTDQIARWARDGVR